ncbi:hypothetical protein EGW08_022522, partial [Elysia chlorotica]
AHSKNEGDRYENLYRRRTLPLIRHLHSPNFEGHGDAQAALERGERENPGGDARAGEPGQAGCQVHNLQRQKRQLQLLEQRVVANGQPHCACRDAQIRHGQAGQGDGHGVLESLLAEDHDVDDVGEHAEHTERLTQDRHVDDDDDV